MLYIYIYIFLYITKFRSAFMIEFAVELLNEVSMATDEGRSQNLRLALSEC